MSLLKHGFLRVALALMGCGGFAVILAGAEAGAGFQVLDHLEFGNQDAEKGHALQSVASEVISGGLGESARRLLPLAPATWEGGTVAFTMQVDPVQPTYATVRFWGSEGSPGRMLLFVEGRQVGYRHLGDIDILDVGTHEPPCAGRFYYVTTPLPTALTANRTSLHCEIRANGPIWGYGDTFERYQKPLTEPTRGIYAIVTHTGGCYLPATSERQGAAPVVPPLRTAPGVEVIAQVKERLNKILDGLCAGSAPLNQIQIHLLAKAWGVSWTTAYHNPKAVARIVASVDALYAKFVIDPGTVRSDKSVYNSEWFATGLAADAVRLLAHEMSADLDAAVPESTVIRRSAWSAMFLDSRDWLRRHRRLYTNQSMITDMNLYRCNRALAAIDPDKALPEAAALRYLREAIGIDPWLGSEDDHGPTKPMGEHYLQLTKQGLTKELGYVGYYGEVLDWVTQIYDATRDPGQAGDPAIRQQLIKVAKARAMFRYPALDAEGNRAMRIEAVVGWRDDHYPGDVTYSERSTWDASALYTVAATLDADDVGAAQQMFADNQFFASVQRQLMDQGLRVSAGLLGIPEQYELINAQPPAGKALPMSDGQPDVVFADDEDGVVAVKNGNEILYASLYWRARMGINQLARVHLITPTFDRIAVVRQQCEFTASGMTCKRPDWTDFGFANGGHRYPKELHSALSGEELPIAKIPAGLAFKPGDESPYAGRADFYRCSYGNYLIGMNSSHERTFTLTLPLGKAGLELVTRQRLGAGASLAIAPHVTRVVLLDP